MHLSLQSATKFTSLIVSTPYSVLRTSLRSVVSTILLRALNDVNGSVCCMKIDAIVSPGETLKATWFVIKCLNLSNRKLLFSNTSQADSGRRGTERLNELIIRRST